jgi:hypothetical protein
MKTVEEYRGFATDCRKLVAELTDPEDKRAVELMAATWEKVANEREAMLKSRSRSKERKLFRSVPLLNPGPSLDFRFVDALTRPAVLFRR